MLTLGLCQISLCFDFLNIGCLNYLAIARGNVQFLATNENGDLEHVTKDIVILSMQCVMLKLFGVW
jgi:hypothetical protein